MSSHLPFCGSRSARPARALACCSSLFASLLVTSSAHALPRTWIGGNVDWVDGGSTANWNPADEPDSDDEAIFNTANTVNLGSNNAVNGLTLSGGIDLFANDFDLTVDGLVQLSGAGTNLIIGNAAGSVDADNVTINGGILELTGGSLSLNEEVGTSLIDLNAGGSLIGRGVISFADTPLAFTTVFSNDGTLTALSRPSNIFNPPPVGTLQINTANAFSLVDLDGAGNAGVVNVNRNQTLDVNGTLADAFGGTMTLAHESTLDMSNAWGMNAGTLTVNNGFVAGGLGVPDILAGVSYVKGGAFSQTGGAISVVDTDGTLQIDVPFTMSGGSLANSGTVIFNGTTSITTAAGYNPSSINAQTIVNANMTINDGAGNFNWDGSGVADTTVNNGSLLSITANQVDTGDDVFGGDIILNDASDLTVNVAATSWTLGGTLTKNDVGTSTVSGDRVVITGSVNANAGTLDMPAVTTSASATVNAAGTLTFGGASELAGGDLQGAGLLRMEGTSTVSASTTVNVATFDWDGLGTGTSHTISAGAIFTINSGALDSDGDMDDPFTLAGAGSQLFVNNSSGLTQWTVNGTVTANASGAGTSTIGGTSRMIVAGLMNVDGNTTISAPVTFNRAGIVADIDAGKVLDVTSSLTTYADGTIDGAGTFDPGISNFVTGDFAVNSDNFDFDGGTWTIENGARLVFNVVDYEPDSATNSLETTLTLNNGRILANAGDPEFVMNGTLNMNASGGNGAEWDGDPLDIGNDAGALDADLNVTGDGNPNSQGRIFSNVDFNADADVNVGAGAALLFVGSVSFNTVNGGNNAEFTGAGSMSFSNLVNVNEAVTLNMVGGTVDLDGNDASGEFINIDAPLTINAATFANFGRVNGGGGINTLDVNNSVGLGVLTVNLDDPNAEWTLNAPGVMNLVNDVTPATLLAGSDVNVNGTVSVNGDVRTTARLDIAGTVNINTVAEPFRLAGGDNVSDPNTLAGGTVNGLGVLGADAGKELRGFGTINTAIDFDGTAKLRADNGTLTVNGAIVDADTVGTADADGTFHVTNAWNNNVTASVQLNGGVVSGGPMTNDVAAGVSGHGLVTARVINNSRLTAADGTLVVQTGANDNDWDGAGAGQLRAIGGGNVLEIRDTGAAFAFSGNVTATNGGRVYANGFGLDFQPASTINLTAATLETDESTDLGGSITVAAGLPSTIQVQNNRFLSFESGSSTTLNGNLQLLNNNIIVDAGATFSGTGALIVPDGSHMVADNLANVGVLLDMQGALRPGNSEGIGRIDLFDYQQSSTAELFIEITGTALNAFDRLVASGDVVLDGFLSLDIDDVSPGVPFVPSLGQTFNIITGNTVTGTFDTVDVSGMPAGLAFHLNYLSNAVQLQVVNKPILSADFDEDGDVDSTDLSIWDNAFDLNQLGDADGDNDSDGADFLLWQRQFGSVPAVAAAQPAAGVVPEPSGALLLLLAAMGLRRPSRH